MQPAQRRGDRLQRQNVICRAEPYGFPGHTEDRAGGFVLGDGNGSRRLHRQQPGAPVIPHSGENHPQRLFGPCHRSGSEQHIDGGPLETDAWSLAEFNFQPGGTILYLDVLVSWCDPRDTRMNAIACFRLLDPNRGTPG